MPKSMQQVSGRFDGSDKVGKALIEGLGRDVVVEHVIHVVAVPKVLHLHPDFLEVSFAIFEELLQVQIILQLLFETEVCILVRS